MQYSSARLTWHGGFIPENEIWVKLGGDRGGGIFKATFQIVNVPNPNSVLNTCVFCCFMAGDSTYNLHVALDRYKLQVNKLQGMRWKYHYQRVSSSTFTTYSAQLQRLQAAKSELEVAKHSKETTEQLATYMVLLYGEESNVVFLESRVPNLFMLSSIPCSPNTTQCTTK